jgi:hypothetical protein
MRSSDTPKSVALIHIPAENNRDNLKALGRHCR